VLLFTSANAAIAHNASVVTISAPSNDQTIIIESFPVNVIVEGTISHGSPGNFNDQPACVNIDGGTPTCEPNYVGGFGRVSSRNFTITVPISNEGQHTIQATTANSSGDHSGTSSLITITVLLANVPCDEKDPPAYANGYLNGLNLPRLYYRPWTDHQDYCQQSLQWCLWLMSLRLRRGARRRGPTPYAGRVLNVRPESRFKTRICSPLPLRHLKTAAESKVNRSTEEPALGNRHER
jgi:hypothetical protein